MDICGAVFPRYIFRFSIDVAELIQRTPASAELCPPDRPGLRPLGLPSAVRGRNLQRQLYVPLRRPLPAVDLYQKEGTRTPQHCTEQAYRRPKGLEAQPLRGRRGHRTRPRPLRRLFRSSSAFEPSGSTTGFLFAVVERRKRAPLLPTGEVARAASTARAALLSVPSRPERL